MEPSREEPQLTFWLNKYYQDIDFDGDVFQTWAPVEPPNEELVIKKFELSRVIHTSSSKEMVKAVQAAQGKNKIYYAGSYAVYGMGLLEQAAKSGRIAAELALNNLFDEK
jgi:predicted NAD/FAD-binding protein